MSNNKEIKDFVLIGGGIMSATLGMLLHELMPDATMEIYERLDEVALESSQAWNNAGTGHSAFCELNYTSEKPDGSISISKAISIAEQFEQSRQFWAYLIRKSILDNPASFITATPHCSFVQNNEDILFLNKRFEALSKEPLFKGMIYTEDIAEMQHWFPLIMEQRSDIENVAATKMDIGTDVNFGKLTHLIFTYLQSQHSANVYTQHEVKDIDRNDDGTWEVEIEDLQTGDTKKIDAKFVFAGAGGGSLKLLNKADIDEIDGYGGFPVGGKWLRCKNDIVINQHNAKVYGKAEIGAPPMSVPHLDTRMIEGKKEMLFGPYAGFSTKFLKHGSYWDLPASIDFDNFIPMIQAGAENFPLTKYLVEQVRMNFDEKFEALQKYYPAAQKEDWELVEAGQRVQVIKKDKEGNGVLEFGTELIATKDGTLAGLLGASPGASTCVSIMLNLLQKCFANEMATTEWQRKLCEMIPSYGKQLNSNETLLRFTRDYTKEMLQL